MTRVWPPRKLEDFGELLPAEEELRRKVINGQLADVGSGVPSKIIVPELTIRSTFLTYLILGGCDSCRPHSKGVQVQGAQILGDDHSSSDTKGIDLASIGVELNILLAECRVFENITLRFGRFEAISFQGSVLQCGLNGDGLSTRFGFNLSSVCCGDEVRMVGAAIGGDLNCTGAVFGAKKIENGAWSKALGADRVTVDGNVWLDKVESKGEVRFSGAKILGDFSCSGAKFYSCKNPNEQVDNALNLGSCKIDGTFFLRENTEIKGRLNLTSARIGHIFDEAKSWPDVGNLYLDHCTYGSFTRKDGIDAKSRLNWLNLRDPKKFSDRFFPQPYEQCAKVLREMGHPADARAVLIEKERLQRLARRVRSGNAIAKAWLLFWDTILNGTIKYGHQPLWAFGWILDVWLIGAVIFAWTDGAWDFKPASVSILASTEWVECRDSGKLRNTEPSQLDCYLSQPEAASYPPFNSLVYSADTLLPIISLGMEANWVPDDKQWVGRIAWWYLIGHIVLGWALSLLAVAGFSGLVKRD